MARNNRNAVILPGYAANAEDKRERELEDVHRRFGVDVAGLVNIGLAAVHAEPDAPVKTVIEAAKTREKVE